MDDIFDDLCNKVHDDTNARDNEDVDPEESVKIMRRKEAKKAQTQRTGNVAEQPKKAPLSVQLIASHQRPHYHIHGLQRDPR